MSYMKWGISLTEFQPRLQYVHGMVCRLSASTRGASMTLTELETAIAVALPIFKKYSPDPAVVLSSGPAPISLQDFLFSAMSESDRSVLKAAGWRTNGFIAWYYQTQ
jgi:hypothetical protein